MKNKIIKNKIKIIIILFFGMVVLFIFFRFVIGGPEDNWICRDNVWERHGNPQSPPPIRGCGKEQIIGGDRDEHGCIGSAGYSWCAIKNKCLRVWEEPCK